MSFSKPINTLITTASLIDRTGKQDMIDELTQITPYTRLTLELLDLLTAGETAYGRTGVEFGVSRKDVAYINVGPDFELITIENEVVVVPQGYIIFNLSRTAMKSFTFEVKKAIRGKKVTGTLVAIIDPEFKSVQYYEVDRLSLALSKSRVVSYRTAYEELKDVTKYPGCLNCIHVPMLLDSNAYMPITWRGVDGLAEIELNSLENSILMISMYVPSYTGTTLIKSDYIYLKLDLVQDKTLTQEWLQAELNQLLEV